MVKISVKKNIYMCVSGHMKLHERECNKSCQTGEN